MGPWAGWIAGWAIIVADIIVMANLAQIAGLYTLPALRLRTRRRLDLRGHLVGVIWIVVMTAICVDRHRALRPHAGRFLLGAEVVTLALFAVVALVKVYAGTRPTLVDPCLLVHPFAIDSPARSTAGVLLGGVHLLGLGQRA